MWWKSVLAFLTSIGITGSQLIVVLLIILAIIIVFKSEKISKLFKKFSIKRKRSCKDCFELLFSKDKQFDMEVKRLSKKQEKVENNVLKSQMNFAEQKLIEINLRLNTFYNNKLRDSKIKGISEVEQYRMFYGLLKDALNIELKDEIRRAFKENGFYEISGAEFAAYVKEKVQTLISMLKQYMVNMYPNPSDTLIVSLDAVLKCIKDMESKFEDKVFEMFIEAKKIQKEAYEKINKFDDEINNRKEKLQSEIDELIKGK